jgi:hypothetical protein
MGGPPVDGVHRANPKLKSPLRPHPAAVHPVWLSGIG